MKRIEPETRGGFRYAANNRLGLVVKQERSQTRLETRGEKRVIKGYAAVYFKETDRAGTEYWIWDDMVERIMPGAFDRAISEAHDARALFNHDGNWLLGRVSSGTARIGSDDKGLWYEIDEDRSDPQWQTVAAKIDRGDITGSSFAFRATKTDWTETPDYWVRQLVDVDLFDISPVTWPAYSGTSAGRSADYHSAPSDIQNLLQERNAALYVGESVTINARLASLGLPIIKG